MLGSKHVSLKVSILTFGIVFIIFVASLTVFLLIIKIQPFKKHKTDQVKERFDSDEALLTSTVGLKSSYLTTKYQEDKTMTTSMKRPLSKEFSECQEYIFFKGDGFCDDDVNTPECNFDGGDCCGENIAIGLCGICLCHTNETYLSSNDLWIIFNFFQIEVFLCFQPMDACMNS